MSYDVSLKDTAGHPVGNLDRNYTYNVSRMFSDVVGSTPNDWNGKPTPEVADLCERIVIAMVQEPKRFAAMNPANGWGDSIGARGFILDIMDACRAHPNAFLEVC